MRLSALSFLSCGFIAAACLSAAQAPPAQSSGSSPGQAASTRQEQPIPTFHAETRIVVVDVVVTSHRQPVTGLAKSDFTLLEDGERQQILFFEPHVPPAEAKLRAETALPPHQYTNVSPQAPSSINIVLFDAMNTPLVDQPYARDQMLKFLTTLPPGQQLALFELGSQLRMIAGFTTRTEDLIAAARRTVVHHSETLDTREERQQDEIQLGQMREGSMNQGFFDLMQQFMDENWQARDQNRAYRTLQAFADLTHAVSGFRGRKNVLWLSEEFPVYLGPEINPHDPQSNVHSYADLTRDIEGRLSASQMSIYPIDVRGLTPAIPGAAAGGRGGGSADPIVDIENLHMAMDELAKQTGGRAFYNTNDLSLAMQRSLEEGSHYYTLAYAPRNHNWNSRYRRVRVVLAPPGLEASYRKGYFAVPEKPPPEDQSRSELIRAIEPATPQSTMLKLHAQVLPPDAAHANVRIDCTIDLDGLAFSDAASQRKDARLEFVTVAWDATLHEAMNATHTVKLDLPPETYERLMRTGITAHQELKLKPGNYTVRVGIMDDASGKIGTLDLPVQVGEAQSSAGR